MNIQDIHPQEIEKKARNIASKVIRILTVPPVLALLMFTYLWFFMPSVFITTVDFVLAVLFICVLPSLAYAVQPALKRWFPGRDGQRNLAMIFSVTGYICGFVTCLALHQSAYLFLIYCAYFICGLSVLISSKVFHFKLSGHAVGVAGPVAILTIFRQPICLIGIPILVFVFISSYQLKRHTIPQIVSGIIVPFVVGVFLAFTIHP